MGGGSLVTTMLHVVLLARCSTSKADQSHRAAMRCPAAASNAKKACTCSLLCTAGVFMGTVSIREAFA